MLNNEIDNVEPFIEEYYPRIEKDIYNKEEPIIDLNKTNENNYQSSIFVKELKDEKVEQKKSKVKTSLYLPNYNSI